MTDNATLPATGTGTANLPVNTIKATDGSHVQTVQLGQLAVGGALTLNPTVPVSVADGADLAEGATADLVIAAGAAGSISAKLRAISRDLVANIVLKAGSAIIGQFGIDQTTPGTTNRTQAGGTTVDVDANFSRPTDTNAYAINDSVSSSTSAPTVITFTGVARSSGGTGVILDAVLIDESNPSTTGIFDLYLFDTTFTPTNDNAAMALAASVYRTFIGVISFNVVLAGGANGQQYHAKGVNLAFVTVGSANIFGQLVARNAYTPANAGRFDVRLKVLQD